MIKIENLRLHTENLVKNCKIYFQFSNEMSGNLNKKQKTATAK